MIQISDNASVVIKLALIRLTIMYNPMDVPKIKKIIAKQEVSEVGLSNPIVKSLDFLNTQP